ncbi:MAG TPA: alpha/beta hydrolase-fold protein [Candidatus Solibacter sp.]
MRILLFLIACSAAQAYQRTAVIQDLSHRSQVMDGPRAYRVYLPPDYAKSPKRYPVVYWFHGYDADTEARDAVMAAYVGTHDLILVDSGPVETTGTFPLYFPELAERIDATFRTLADRDHRGVTGAGIGGFYAIWQASKCPDLVGSASSAGAATEASVGPRGFDLESAIDELYPTLDAVRIRQSAASATVPEMLDFHLDTFAHPVAKPSSFSHIDPYPNFGVWNWEVVSDRRWPAFTVLENVSRSGFRSVVREWVPAGAALPNVKLTITSPRLYTASTVYPVYYIRLRDGFLRKAMQKSDAQGRLTFEVNGEEYEVGIGVAPVLALSGFEITNAAWAASGRPVQLRLKVLNKGGAHSLPAPVKWGSSSPGVKVTGGPPRLPALAPGESVAIALTCNFERPATSGARITATEGAATLAIDIPVFPQAEPVTEYRIADGIAVPPYQRPLGEGNGDGHAAPGESFALLLPDSGALRAAELFTNDSCVDNTARITDSGARISVPTVRPACQPGHRIQALARIGLRYFTVEIPVWYRNEPRP